MRHPIVHTRHAAVLRRRHGEAGAILVLAIAFLTVVLTLAVSLVTLAYSGSTSLKGFRIERARRYAADGALTSALQYVKVNPTLGQSTGSPACSMTYPITEYTDDGALSVVSSGSYLTVTCEATPGTTSGGVDVDGGQKARDVTFTVSCQGAPPAANGKLTCGGSGPVQVVGRARVQYLPDYDLVPSGSTCAPSTTDCYAHNARAVVPKTVTWSVKG